MRYLRFAFGFVGISTLLGLGTAPPAQATLVGFDFDASLETGALTGTTFPGTGSYDTAGTTGIGEEFLTLELIAVFAARGAVHQGGYHSGGPGDP